MRKTEREISVSSSDFLIPFGAGKERRKERTSSFPSPVLFLGKGELKK